MSQIDKKQQWEEQVKKWQEAQQKYKELQRQKVQQIQKKSSNSNSDDPRDERMHERRKDYGMER